MKIKLLKSISLILCFALIFNIAIIPVSAAGSEEQLSFDHDYCIFSKELILNDYSVEIDGSVYSGNNLKYTGNRNCLINGTLNCSNTEGESITADNTVFNAEPMPDYTEKLDNEVFYKTIYDTDTFISDPEYDLATPMSVNGTLFLDQVILKNKGYIKAADSIKFNAVNDGINDYSVFMYSENGSIQIQGTDLVINGILYAPNGKIELNAKKLTINGMVIADKVEFNGSELSVNKNEDYYIFYKTNDSIDNDIIDDIIMFKNGQWFDTKQDSDGDGLPDYLEIVCQTDMQNPDTDGDKLPDGYEILTIGTDPTDADTDNNSITDADEDTDGDGLKNLDEYRSGTDPLNKDSDNDQLTDYDELFRYGTDPKNDDSDKDKLSDGDEIALGFDPNTKDSDNNGIIDGDEIIHQLISEDNEGLSYVNNDDNPYCIELEIDSAGNAAKSVCAEKSPYDNYMKNPAILGEFISLSCESIRNIENIKIKFKLNHNIVEKPENNDLLNSEINGIKRFKIFKYDEENNILLPVDCDYDTNNNEIIFNDNSLGIYCIINLRKWVENMGIEVNDEPIEEEKELPAGMVYGRRSTGSGASQNDSEDEYIIDDESFFGGDPINSDLPSYSSKNNNVDIVFILQSEGLVYQEYFKQVNYIRGIAKCLIGVFDNTRIAVMLSNSNEASFLISSESSKWFTEYSDLDSKLNEIGYSRYNDYINRGAAFDKLIKSTDFIDSSYKFVYLMHNTISTVRDGYHDQIDACNLLNINYSEILPEGLYYISSEYCSKVKKVVSNSGGQYFYMSNYDDDIKKITSNIYNSVPFEYTDNTSENYYVTVTPSNWNQVRLDKPLEKDGITDTDSDGLTDWEETDYDNSSITVYPDNSTRLPNIIEYSVYQNKPEIIAGIESIIDHIGIYDSQRIRILAVKSYPDNPDSDGDLVLDNKDLEPLNASLYGNFLYYLKELESVLLYQSSIGKYYCNPGQEKWLIAMYLRHFDDNYCKPEWDMTGGKINQDFINLIETDYSDINDYFKKNRYVYSKYGCLDVWHFGATLSAYLYETDFKDGFIYTNDTIKMLSSVFSAQFMLEIHINALAGWAGDLQSLCIDFYEMNDYDIDSINEMPYQFIYNYTHSALKNELGSRFTSSDLFADIDAFIVYKSDLSNNLTNILSDYYNYNYEQRFKLFYEYVAKEAYYADRENLIQYDVDLYFNLATNYFMRPQYIMVVQWPILKHKYKDSAGNNKTIYCEPTNQMCNGIIDAFTNTMREHF